MARDPPSDVSASPNSAAFDAPTKKLPKGVVLGKDGKPCRTCTSFASWASQTKSQKNPPPSSSASTNSNVPTTTAVVAAAAAAAAGTTTPTQPPECPPDIDQLGRSTWTFLHTLTATYPTEAPNGLQSQTRQFLSLFGELYPCWTCAEDFRDWMARPGNEPRVRGRGEFGLWMCAAHNEVNRKLGKEEFDCRRWEERWRDGWRDGSCD